MYKNGKRNKFKIAFAILGGITIFGGASIWGGFSVFQSLVQVVLPDNEPKNNMANKSNEPIATEEPTASPTKKIEKAEENEPQPSPIVLKVEKTEEDVDMDEIKKNSVIVSPIPKEHIDEQLPTSTDKTTLIDDYDSNLSEDSKNEENSENTDKDDESNDVEIDNSDTSSTKYKLNIKTSGQLLLISDENDKNEGNIDISYQEDEFETTEQQPETFNLVDIVNECDSTNPNKLNYINVIPGVYIFEFFDCDFNNFNFYIINDIENYAKVCDENESQINNLVDAEIAVPTEEDVKIEMQQEESTSLIKIFSENEINPLIKFSSEENINGTLKILDNSKKELFTCELEQLQDNIVPIDDSFTLYPEDVYYIQIIISPTDDLSERVYYLNISSKEDN